MSKSYTKYGEEEKACYYFVHLQLLPVIRHKRQKQRGPVKLWVHFTTEIVLQHLSLWKQSAALTTSNTDSKLKGKKSKIIRCENRTADR